MGNVLIDESRCESQRRLVFFIHSNLFIILVRSLSDDCTYRKLGERRNPYRIKDYVFKLPTLLFKAFS